MLETAPPFSASAAPIPRPAGRLSALLREAAVAAAFGANALAVAVLWLRHGHFDETSPASVLMAAGQLCALFGTYLALVGMLLVARTPLLDSILGDRTRRLHRLLGSGAVLLVTLHVGATIAGFAILDGVSPAAELSTVVLTYPWMVAAAAGFALFAVIGLTSTPWIRRRLSYETWTGLHLYAYLAVLLAFGHQLAVGSDFVGHPLAQAYWAALYVVVFGCLLACRVLGPLRLSIRHRFRVALVTVESPDMVSVHVAGRRLDELKARPGQYFRIRLLMRNEWWRSHPFSLSAVPDRDGLRFTIKALGDFSERIQRLQPGVRVMLEGPYGALTSARRTTDSVVLIGGGIGVSPIRALFEELAGRIEVTMLYRASRDLDVVFFDELAALERRTGARIRYLVGKRGSHRMPADPLSAESLRRLVPDIATRDVFVCGPLAMMDAIEGALRELGVPRRRIHTERFA